LAIPNLFRDGRHLYFELQTDSPSEVYDEEDKIVPGLTGETESDHTCRMNIAGITQDLFGKWKCIFNPNEEVRILDN